MEITSQNGLSNKSFSRYITLLTLWSIYTFFSREYYLKNDYNPVTMPFEILQKTLSLFAIILTVYVLFFLLVLRFLSPDTIQLTNFWNKINHDLFSTLISFSLMFLFGICLVSGVTWVARHYIFRKFKQNEKSTIMIIMIAQWICITQIFFIYSFM